MSKASSSPTARLLQSSRLFAIPKPLPTPPSSLVNKRQGRASESPTATTPYPTHQAIDTPYVSRAIGEWGLKRHLPIKTTTISDLPIRVTAQDTNDHVTDFAPSDLTMAVEKFQELGIPILRREDGNSSVVNAIVSVYEDYEDTTDRVQGGHRWKQDGPHLAALQAYEVEELLANLHTRRSDWLKFLRNYFMERKFQEMKEEAIKKTGFFGPLDAQDLLIQRDAVAMALNAALHADGAGSTSTSPEAPSTAEGAAGTTESGGSADIARRREELEMQIETRSQQREAIQHFYKEQRRIQQLLTFAQNASEIELQRAADEEDTAAAQQKLETVKHNVSSMLVELDREVSQRLGLDEASASSDSTIATRIQQTMDSITQEDEERRGALSAWENETFKSTRPTKEELIAFEKTLRDAHRQTGPSARSELYDIVVKFLDLPGMVDRERLAKLQDRAANLSNTSFIQNELVAQSVNGRTSTPFTTHPGAGLGYLRSQSHMENHPLHGPQARRTPVLSRVIRARQAAQSSEVNAKIGIGGFVALDPKGTRVGATAWLEDPLGTEAATAQLQPYLEGGNKAYMHPEFARIDENGRTIVTIKRPDPEAVAVLKGDVSAVLSQKKAVFGPPPAGLPRTMFPNMQTPHRPARRDNRLFADR